MSTSDITLHHLDSSRSERVFWALEEMGLPYNVKCWYRTSDRKAPVEMKQIHPLGKSPMLVDSDQTLIESAYILKHLLKKDPSERFAVNDRDEFWSNYSEASVMAFIHMSRAVAAAGKQAPFYAKTVVNAFVKGIHDQYFDLEIQKHFDFIESELAKSQWLGGKSEPSLADFMALTPINATLNDAERRSIINVGPKTDAWMKAVEARPAYQKAVKRRQEEEKAQKK